MSYCSECGRQLSKDDKFCSNCGRPIEVASRQRSSVRQEKWEGSVFKCPRCGEVITAYSQQCPSCGFELRDVDSVRSVRELAAKIEASWDDNHRALLVRSFPIPNSREDIIEFLIMAVTNIDENSPYGSEEAENLTRAWIAKADQALQKAKLVIPKDEIYARSKMSFDKKVKLFEKARNKNKHRRTNVREKTSDIKVVFIVLGIIIIFCLAYLFFVAA